MYILCREIFFFFCTYTDDNPPADNREYTVYIIELHVIPRDLRVVRLTTTILDNSTFKSNWISVSKSRENVFNFRTWVCGNRDFEHLRPISRRVLPAAFETELVCRRTLSKTTKCFQSVVELRRSPAANKTRTDKTSYTRHTARQTLVPCGNYNGPRAGRVQRSFGLKAQNRSVIG